MLMIESLRRRGYVQVDYADGAPDPLTLHAPIRVIGTWPRVSPKVRDAGISCSVTASQTYTEIEPRLRRSRAAIYSPWRSDRAESENHTLGVERGRPDTWMQPGGRAERVERHASLESIRLDPAAQFPTRSRADLVPTVKAYLATSTGRTVLG